MEFYNNKENDTLKFKINTEGVDVGSIDPRLLFVTNESTNYLVKGKIEGDICVFDVPMLHEYSINSNGNVVFEIVSGDMYFKVWNEAFTVKTKPSVVLTDVNEVKKESNAPSITVDAVKVEPIKEEKKPIAEKKKSVKSSIEHVIEEDKDVFLDLVDILKD